jgi:hypothetical protein
MYISHSLHRYSVSVSRQVRALLLLPLLLMFVQSPAFAWVYPEHRDITLRGIQKLDPRQKAVLDKLWAAARTGHESRLSVTPGDVTSGENPGTIDYAAWPAIAGDHSCSAANMLHNVLESDWILNVAAVSARLKTELFEAGSQRHDRINALRRSDIRLLRVDPEYASRAGANNVHFLLARPYAETDEKSYVETCLGTGCELNAIGTYAWFHLSAIQKAHRLTQGNLTGEEASSLIRAALADEGFALHFLEDVFASGHVAGTRGDASQRKGTHDYYNEHGLEARTWDGQSMVLKGDAWMRPEDAERASRAVGASLEQFLQASEGNIASTAFSSSKGFLVTADTLNVCRLEVMPDRDLEAGIGPLLSEIIMATPIPGLSEGDGELPRFRSELGPFIGIAPAVRGSVAKGGFETGQTAPSGMGSLEIGVRIGLGLAGVLSEAGDGLICFDLGFRHDGPSTTSIFEDEVLQQFGQILAAVPSRSAFTFRLRTPFWLIPLDLIFTAPFLLPTAPETYTSMAVLAGNGGLIPWQTGFATSFGRFQLVLGREIAVSLYGYMKNPERILLPIGDAAPGQAVLADMHSVQLEFPFLEYRPFRSFSLDQTSSLVVQLFASVDIPTSITNLYPPGIPEPELRPIWQFGVRVAFDWRYYW